MYKSNCPMCGVAGYPAGTWCLDCSAEIQRKRDALQTKLAVLEEARRRLEEIQHNAGGAESSDTAGDDDFYPLVDDDNDDEPEERPMQWQDQVCRQMIYNSSSGRHQLRQDDDGHLAADSNNNHDLDDGDGGDEISRDLVALGLHVPHIQQTGTTATRPRFVVPGGDGDGFGAVPASAAAIAGLEKDRYDDGSPSGGGDSMCVICMTDYKKGRRLRVMPCAHKHRFHGRCIREWLSRSNMCPLCRHALPTVADAEQGEGGGGGAVRSRRVLVRVNVNPY